MCLFQQHGVMFRSSPVCVGGRCCAMKQPHFRLLGKHSPRYIYRSCLLISSSASCRTFSSCVRACAATPVIKKLGSKCEVHAVARSGHGRTVSS